MTQQPKYRNKSLKDIYEETFGESWEELEAGVRQRNPEFFAFYDFIKED